MKRILKARRGLSPIVSSLLLLLTTVIAFSTVLAYTNNFMSAQRNNILSTIRERLVVEDIWFRPNNMISIYITNVGTVPLEIAEVHVNNENVGMSPYPLKLVRFEIGEVQISYNWVSGNEYSFVIVTERGYYVEIASTAP